MARIDERFAAIAVVAAAETVSLIAITFALPFSKGFEELRDFTNLY